MKDVSFPHDTDLPEEKRKSSESSRFKPDNQTGKKAKTGPFISPELNRHFRIFGKHKDQPPTHPSEVPTHQMTKYDRPSTLKEVVSGWKIPNFNIHPLMIPTIYRYAENLQELIKKVTESPDIDVRDHIKFSRERKILHQIIVEILTKKKIKDNTTLKSIITPIYEHCISEGMRLSKDEIHDIIVERTGDLPNLDIHPNLGRTTFFVTGGPANGKSTLTRLLSERNIGDLNEALVINPDNLKDVLLDSGSLDKNSAQHDDLTHEESSYIVHKLLEPELQKLIDSNIAPDVFFDVVDAKLPRIEKVSESGCNVAIYNVTCDAGTAIERAFQRGIYTNRFIPTEVVLSGNRKNAANLGMYVTLAEHFELFDTNTQDCSLIADKIGRESPLNIYEQRLFEAHLLKKHMNITADNPGALYSLQDLSAERRAKDYYDLVTQGVNLAFHDKNAGKTYAVFNRRDGIIINDVDAFIAGVRTPGGGEPAAFAAAMIQSFIVEGLDVKIRQQQAHRKSLYAKGGRLLYADRYITEKLSIESLEVYNESQEDPKTRHSKQGRVEEGTRGGNAPRESRTRGSHFTPATGESSSHLRDDREAVSTGNERELDRQYYIRKALSNLAATSRTSAGTIDTSGSRGKERLMQATSGDEAAKKAVSNYAAVLEYLYDEKGRQFGSADDLRRFVEQVARNINSGITREGVLLRETDSGKFPYTPVQHLERASNQFYNELFRRLGDPNIDPVETAAWIEYRVNLTDHFFADGCGKISSALATYVGMRTGVELPTFSERSEIFQHAPKELRTTSDPLADKQFLTWWKYYRSKYSERYQRYYSGQIIYKQQVDKLLSSPNQGGQRIRRARSESQINQGGSAFSL